MLCWKVSVAVLERRASGYLLAAPPGPGVVVTNAVIITSDVVVEKKFVRVRAQANFIELARPLVAEMGFHNVLREHVSFEKELMLSLERIKRFLKRSRGRWHFGTFLRRQVVKILVDRLTGIDAILD